MTLNGPGMLITSSGGGLFVRSLRRMRMRERQDTAFIIKANMQIHTQNRGIVLGLCEFQMNRRAYTTESSIISMTINGIFQGRTEHMGVHPGLNIATHHFIEPYPLVKEIERFSLVTMDLLNQFAYPYMSGYAKFTVTLTIHGGREYNINNRCCHPPYSP